MASKKKVSVSTNGTNSSAVAELDAPKRRLAVDLFVQEKPAPKKVVAIRYYDVVKDVEFQAEQGTLLEAATAFIEKQFAHADTLTVNEEDGFDPAIGLRDKVAHQVMDLMVIKLSGPDQESLVNHLVRKANEMRHQFSYGVAEKIRKWENYEGIYASDDE